MKKATVFWDVDTQYDFMDPRGKLYVPGAEGIIDAVSEIRRFALENGFSIIADIDWHSPTNAEISETPDFKQTFPPHCIAGDPGGDRVGYLGDVPIEYVDTDYMGTDALRKLAARDQFHIVIRKESIDVFSNPNTDELVELTQPKSMVVFGVALDFCVYYVLKGLAKHPNIRLYVLKDAVKGLDVRPEEEIFDELRRMGVVITDFDEFKRRLQCG
ncbi:MAG: cysteine hydrolase [Phycisphaerales bacterium]|nr:MAG: cysteine hydrolase [Phycisphaerales bacterium]